MQLIRESSRLQWPGVMYDRSYRVFMPLTPVTFVKGTLFITVNNATLSKNLLHIISLSFLHTCTWQAVCITFGLCVGLLKESSLLLPSLLPHHCWLIVTVIWWSTHNATVEVCGEYIAKQCHLHHRAIFLQSIFINSHILKFQPHYVNISFWFWDVAGIMFITMLCQRQRVELLTEVSGGNLINHSSLITGVTTVFEGLILFTPCWETGLIFTGSWDCKVQVIGSVDHQTFYFVSKACTYLKLEFTPPR